MVYLVTLSWKYPEDGVKLVGIFSTKEDAEKAAKDTEEAEAAEQAEIAAESEEGYNYPYFVKIKEIVLDQKTDSYLR